MDIYKIPACWPTTCLYGIPISDMLLKENLIDNKYKSSQQTTSSKIDSSLMDFIFQFCLVANLSKETAQSTVIIFEYYITHVKDITKYDIQLVVMTCILVCSKMFDVKPLTLSTLHRISAYIYNNQMVLTCEKYILSLIEYDLLLRDNLLVDRVGLYLESCRFLLDEKDFDKFKDVCLKMTDLLHEDMRIIKETDLSLLCAALIHASLVISTKRDGKLPMTIKGDNSLYI